MARGKPGILLLTGGGYHDFERGAKLIQQTLANRFRVTHTTKVSDLAPLHSGRFQAVVIYAQGGNMTDAQANGLEKFVAAAAGWWVSTAPQTASPSAVAS